MTRVSKPECRAMLSHISAYLDGDLDATECRTIKRPLSEVPGVCLTRGRIAAGRRAVPSGGHGAVAGASQRTRAREHPAAAGRSIAAASPIIGSPAPLADDLLEIEIRRYQADVAVAP
jgi:hypothetical protein